MKKLGHGRPRIKFCRNYCKKEDMRKTGYGNKPGYDKNRV